VSRPTKRSLPKPRRIGLGGRLFSLWLARVLCPHVIGVLRQTWTLGGWQFYVNLALLAVLIGATLSELWIALTGLE
jgi:hypothetical protein